MNCVLVYLSDEESDAFPYNEVLTNYGNDFRFNEQFRRARGGGSTDRLTPFMLLEQALSILVYFRRPDAGRTRVGRESVGDIPDGFVIVGKM